MRHDEAGQGGRGRKVVTHQGGGDAGKNVPQWVSDMDNGRISATIDMSAGKAPKAVVLRFRHRKSAPIKAVTVNGKPWTEFSKDKEAIILKGLTGTVVATAQY